MKNYRLAWCSDLHLDFIRLPQRQKLIDAIASSRADGLLITGDIATSRRISENLKAIAAAGLPTYFVTGNHDYYAGDFKSTDEDIAGTCRQFGNLTRLGLGEVVMLGAETVLIGHGGWADGRAGLGRKTDVRLNDSLLIADLRRSGPALFDKLAELGAASAAYIERMAEFAAHQARRIVIATHVPPYVEASRHEGASGDPSHLPHFTNVALGESLRRVASRWPMKEFVVICGHTHERCTCQAAENLVVKVAGASYGAPAIEDVLSF